MTTPRVQPEKEPGVPLEPGALQEDLLNETGIPTIHSGQSTDGHPPARERAAAPGDHPWQLIAEITLANVPGNEELEAESAAAVAGVIGPLRLPPQRQERLIAAVKQAALNAAGHTAGPKPGQPVFLRILAPREPASADPTGSARGWGYFLIEKMTDPGPGDPHPVVEIFLYQEGGS